MNTVGKRIRELRKRKDFTQTQLGELVGLTYIQIGRYETGKSMPSSDVLQKIATVLDTSTDFLMNGNNDMATRHLSDEELLKQFKEVEQLDQEDQNLIKTFIDAFLTKRKLQQLA